MAQSFEQYQRRRLISSYFSADFSLFLVLFLLGALGLFVINSEKISNDFKENIPMSVYFKDEANDTILNAFDTELKNSKFIRTKPKQKLLRTNAVRFYVNKVFVLKNILPSKKLAAEKHWVLSAN